jgi:hypothetical protein
MVRQEEDRVGLRAPGPVLSLRTHKEVGLQRPSLTVLGDDVGFGVVLYGVLRVVDDPGHLVHMSKPGGALRTHDPEPQWFTSCDSIFSNAPRRGRNGRDLNHYTVGTIREVPGGG